MQSTQVSQYVTQLFSSESMPTDFTGTLALTSSGGPVSIIALPGLFLILSLGALSVVYFNRPEPPAPPEIRVEVSTPPTSDPLSFAISPDGRRLVFSASNEGKSQLWVRPLDSLAAQPLPGTDGASYPFWSPDSASVGFFADSQLKRHRYRRRGAAARSGRVLDFFTCDHRPTGINSERRSAVRSRKNLKKNQTRKARRRPGLRPMRTNRIRCQTKQRRRIRRSGVLHSGASPPILDLG